MGHDLVETLRTMSIYVGWAGEAADQIEVLQHRMQVLENANADALAAIRTLQARIIELEKGAVK